jgi:hypothetical protein
MGAAVKVMNHCSISNIILYYNRNPKYSLILAMGELSGCSSEAKYKRFMN